MPYVALIVLAGLAITGLLVSFGWLPSPIAACVGTLSLILLPGIAITLLLCRDPGGKHPAEHLALWVVTGIVVLAFIGFFGILTKATIRTLLFASALIYASLAIAAVLALRSALSPISTKGSRVVTVVLLAGAVALALSTLVTPRSHDDWFYLAYIRDYSNDMPINSEDAIFDRGAPASPRAGYGAWWVVGAMLSRVTGVDPVPLHQVFLPVLVLPFSVLVLFTLSRQIFKSEKAAYLACFIQIIYYISSASPSDSAGWALLCKTAQDKTISCLIVVPVVLALGLRLAERLQEVNIRRVAGTYALYVLSLVGSTLIHPMGSVWCGVGLVPFLAVEALRQRTHRAGMVLLLLLVPFLIPAASLHRGRVATITTLEERGPGPLMGKGRKSFFEVYVPGATERFRSGDRVYSVSEGVWVAHPSLILRYPLALFGLVLTFVLLRYSRKSYAARYLSILTFSTLLLAFAPGMAGATSALITKKMLYRLAWLFPWGLTIGLFLSLITKRLRWAWLIAVVIALTMCRGNPANYFRVLSATKDFGRPDRELVEVLEALSAEPPPRGVVLASANTSLKIPGYVGDAYPVAFRSEGHGDRIEIRDLFQVGRLDDSVKDVLLGFETRYVIAEKTRPLARALESGDPWVRPVFANKAYGLWEIRFTPKL